MSSKIKTHFFGTLGRPPELRYLPDGKPFTNMSIAVNGNSKDETAWVKVTVFGAQAEPCAKMLRKASVITVDGELSLDKDTKEPHIWEDKSGNPRAEIAVVSTDVRFVSNFGEERGDAPASSKPASKPSPKVDFDEEDEIPF